MPGRQMTGARKQPIETSGAGDSGFAGKRVQSGNSEAFRFDKVLFKQHPEFGGRVRGHILAPGRLLVIAEADPEEKPNEGDPVLDAFLALLGKDMSSRPERIRPMEEAGLKRGRKLVGAKPVDPDHDFGTDPVY